MLAFRGKMAIALGPSALLGALFIWIATIHEPIGQGNAIVFWQRATGVQLPGYQEWRRHGHGFFAPVNDTLIYFTQSHHDRYYYKLTLDSAARRMPDVIERLRAPSDSDSIEPWAMNGYRRWITSGDTSDAASFVRTLYAARMEHLRAENQADRATRDSTNLVARLERANRIGANYLFEWAFLSGWFVFLLWPWVRKATPRRWAIHFGLAPFLLFLPHVLGYAPLTFTYGPSGGFIYPLFLQLAALPMSWLPLTSLDIGILKSIPRPLTPLNQIVGPMSALSSSGAIGPTALAIAGLLLGGFVYWMRVWRTRARNRASQGSLPATAP